MSNLQDDDLAGLRWLQMCQDFVVVVCNEVNGLSLLHPRSGGNRVQLPTVWSSVPLEEGGIATGQGNSWHPLPHDEIV